jgi:hypothetical protein
VEVPEPPWVGGGLVQPEQLEVFVTVDLENVVFVAGFDADDVADLDVVLDPGVQDLRFATTDQVELVGVVVVAVVFSDQRLPSARPATRNQADTCHPGLDRRDRRRNRIQRSRPHFGSIDPIPPTSSSTGVRRRVPGAWVALLCPVPPDSGEWRALRAQRLRGSKT